MSSRRRFNSSNCASLCDVTIHEKMSKAAVELLITRLLITSHCFSFVVIYCPSLLLYALCIMMSFVILRTLEEHSQMARRSMEVLELPWLQTNQLELQTLFVCLCVLLLFWWSNTHQTNFVHSSIFFFRVFRYAVDISIAFCGQHSHLTHSDRTIRESDCVGA